jgi:transcriptional regulator with XRE-family HTH domain
VSAQQTPNEDAKASPRGVTAFQCRVARAALSWSQEYLASITGIDRRRIHRFENNIRVYDHEIVAQHLRHLFEQAGIKFRRGGICYPPEWNKE